VSQKKIEGKRQKKEKADHGNSPTLNLKTNGEAARKEGN